jgi:hypothetical protein
LLLSATRLSPRIQISSQERASIGAMLRRIFNLKAATSLNGLEFNVRPEVVCSLFYEGAWTESWCHRRCQHQHKTIAEAAECAFPQGPTWYVFAVENGRARELTAVEQSSLEDFRCTRWPLKQARGAS